VTDYSHLPEYNIKLLLQKNAIELNILSLAQNKPMTDLVLLDPGLTLLALRYQGTPNDDITFSPFEHQAFHESPDKLYIF